jgi:hypothetical protein
MGGAQFGRRDLRLRQALRRQLALARCALQPAHRQALALPAPGVPRNRTACSTPRTRCGATACNSMSCHQRRRSRPTSEFGSEDRSPVAAPAGRKHSREPQDSVPDPYYGCSFDVVSHGIKPFHHFCTRTLRLVSPLCERIHLRQIILRGFCGDQLCIVMHRGAQFATGATVSC